MMNNTTTYGPDGVTLLSTTVDNGDGTGTKTDYTTDPPTVTQLSGLPIPTPPPPDLDEVFASVPVVSLEEANDTLLALKAALEARGIV